ncbi:hypothetical protein JW859_06085 [bacterium]|nr:hypothetical protein [bacterium]
MNTAYSVALITRGTGAYAFTYAGPAGLGRGQLCAVSFRQRLELGVILGPDKVDSPRELVGLIPVEAENCPGWGALLMDIAELACAAPRDVAGHLLFAPPAQGLKLSLHCAEPAKLTPELRGELASLAGLLTPAKCKALAKVGWDKVVHSARSGHCGLTAQIVGLPGAIRPHSKMRQAYELERGMLKLLGLPEKEQILPGSFLAGLVDDLNFGWPQVKKWRSPEPRASGVRPELDWQPLSLPENWALCQRWPPIAEIAAARAQASWEHLRVPGGLLAEIETAVLASENLLVIAPQAWMLARLWPQLAPLAGRVHRYRPGGGPSAAALVLGMLTRPGQVVLGLEGAWKLAAYGQFDRVLLIDPAHPQYEPEGEPWLDPRLALLVALQNRATRLQLVEFGFSLLDGATRLDQVALLPPYDPRQSSGGPTGRVDLNPLPLKLREAERRRLVYFNRLGQGRGLRCAECGTNVTCPACSSVRVYYSATAESYRCPDCRQTFIGLRCPACGIANLSAGHTGLEAIVSRPGDVLVYGTGAKHRVHAESATVIGTVQLLEPAAEFWPEDIIYVHIAGRGALVDDWPRAFDMVARLRALYANPRIQHLYIVSARLAAKLGAALTADQLHAEFEQEHVLRRLGQLPPYGRACRYRLRGPSAEAVTAATHELVEFLRATGETADCRISRPWRLRQEFLATGTAAGIAPDHDTLLNLRAKLAKQKVQLSLRPVWDPWL